MKLIDATWKGGSAYEVLILADKTPAVLPTSGKADTSSGIPLSYLQMTIDPDTGHLLYGCTDDLKDTLEFSIVNNTNLEVQIHV